MLNEYGFRLSYVVYTYYSELESVLVVGTGVAGTGVAGTGVSGTLDSCLSHLFGAYMIPGPLALAVRTLFRSMVCLVSGPVRRMG